MLNMNSVAEIQFCGLIAGESMSRYIAVAERHAYDFVFRNRFEWC